VLFAISSYTLLCFLRSQHPDSLHGQLPLVRIISEVAMSILALAATITLWRMRRVAAYVLAAQFALSAAWCIYWLFLPPFATPLSNAFGQSPSSIQWLVNTLRLIRTAIWGGIAFYVYTITMASRPRLSSAKPLPLGQ
jgi:hypothetical protein